MKAAVFAVFLSLLLSGCDISGLYDYVPVVIRPQEEGSAEYRLSSGDPLIYFGFHTDTIVFTG